MFHVDGFWCFYYVVTDRISVGGNAIAFVRQSVCRLSIRLFPLYVRNRLIPSTLNFCMQIGHDYSSKEIEGQGQGEGRGYAVGATYVEGRFLRGIVHA